MKLRPDFVVSDEHYGHKNITDYADRPYDWEAMLIKRWRTAVQPSHTVLHLGDLFFARKGGLKHFTEDIVPELPGRHFLVLGNHDARDFDYAKYGFTVLRPYAINYRNFKVSFDHYPAIIHPNDRHLRMHGHIHGHGYGPDGDPTRPYNVNCSIEALDYRPAHFCKLANAAILANKPGRGGKFYNSGSYRQANCDRNRRRAA